MVIEITAAAERDYAAIARIQQASPEAAQWPVGDYSNFNVLLARAGGVPAGFCAWRQSLDDEAELLNLAVHPSYRNQGVARALLEALLHTARGDVFLEVAEDNEPARSLYTALGWLQTGLRKGYYAQGRINAVVMKKRSWYSPG